MFYIGFFIFKKWVIRSFPLFWWAMWANRSGCSPKWTMWANHSGRSPKMSNDERFAQVSPKMSNHERKAQVAHQKWANCSFFWGNHTHSLIFSQKTSDSIRKLLSEFPALKNRQQNNFFRKSILKLCAQGPCGICIKVKGFLRKQIGHSVSCVKMFKESNSQIFTWNNAF